MVLRWLAGFLALAAMAATACGGSGTHEVTGVIIAVDAPSLTELNSFTLRSNSGERLVFHIAPEASRDPQNGFVGGHLHSHLLAANQEQVTYRKQGNELLAEKIVDLL